MTAALAFLLSPLGRWIAGGTVILAVVGALWLDHAHLKAQVAGLAQKAATEHAGATVAQGQTAAGQAALKIVSDGAIKQQITLKIEQDNAHAIASAPGAGQDIDPRLNAVGRRGLCSYAAYADDPECAGLRQPDPAAGPAAGQGNAAPGP